MWQALRSELHSQGLEVVTVSLEVSGPEASRPYIELASPEHPSLLDGTHQMDALFGVVNIPNVVWIDEDGIIVRPAEPGWAGPTPYPPAMVKRLAAAAKSSAEGEPQGAGTGAAAGKRRNPMAVIQTGQDRDAYPDAIRDWVANGPKSRFHLSPADVVARSQPRPLEASQAAAHFELGNQLWHDGLRDGALRHFNASHRLQPGNWTYKRQAWSLVGNERVGGEMGRFTQAPRRGEEDDWPFDSDFNADIAKLEEGQYYPNTM